MAAIIAICLIGAGVLGGEDLKVEDRELRNEVVTTNVDQQELQQKKRLEDCFYLGVKALICNEEGKVLLLKKPSKNRIISWDLPGGRIQKGETLVETLRREVEEETGLKNIEEGSPFAMFLTGFRIPIKGEQENRDVGLILSVYRCDHLKFEPTLSEEHTDFLWVSPHKAAQLLDKYPSEFRERLGELKLE